MSFYEFVSVWRIDASLELVWKTIKQSETWPEWWKGVVSVVELRTGDADGLGSIHRSTWKSTLPYTLIFDSEIVRIEPMKLIEARAFGELEGTGIWQLSFENPNRTLVQYDWQVRTTKPWMNAIAPFARPFFKWNHDVIMRWGQDGLNRRLSEEMQNP